LPAFFFPPLAFFAMIVIPPFMLGLLRKRLTHHGGCRLARSPDVGARRLSGNKEWRKPATLIPDVDYEPELFSVKHKRA
jgi:hypothetical protein